MFYPLEGHRESGAEERLRDWPQALVDTPLVLKTAMPGDAWEPLIRPAPVPLR